MRFCNFSTHYGSARSIRKKSSVRSIYVFRYRIAAAINRSTVFWTWAFFFFGNCVWISSVVLAPLKSYFDGTHSGFHWAGKRAWKSWCPTSVHSCVCVSVRRTRRIRSAFFFFYYVIIGLTGLAIGRCSRLCCCEVWSRISSFANRHFLSAAFDSDAVPRMRRGVWNPKVEMKNAFAVRSVRPVARRRSRRLKRHGRLWVSKCVFT